MRRKRMLVILLALLLALPGNLAGMGAGVKAANKSDWRYYYGQLGQEAKGIYDAMYDMYTQGILKTGTGSYDLVENGKITREQLEAYDGNYTNLLKTMGAARDAFYADYPDIFYVDFSSLSISVENTSDGEVKASLGVGRSTDYYVEGFQDQQQVESAISDHEARVDGIVQEAKKCPSVREQVEYVHNAIIDGTVYRLENNCSSGNRGHIRTSYGALVKGESLCEGYARSVKAVLDSLGVTSVLVQGVLKDTDGSENLHMWNYVQIDGKWYGLDATADDGMKEGTGSDAYLLVDSSVMGKYHIPDGVMSESGFRFTYPKLAEGDSQGGEDTPDDGNEGDSEDDGEYEEVFNKDGLKVSHKLAEGTGIFKVSYKGMGYQDAVDKEGVYMLCRFYQYSPGAGEYKAGDWGYSDPKPLSLPEMDGYLLIPNSNSKIIEFAVTKIPPAGPLYGDDLTAEELKYNWRFHGTDSDFLVSTGKLDNPGVEDFVPSPHARKLTPSNTGFIVSGKKYHVVAEFNEELEPLEGETVGIKLDARGEDPESAIKNTKLENFQWDGGNKVEFDLTTSVMFADNDACYEITVTGARGVGSLKEPDAFNYYSKRKLAVCAYRPQGIFWNVYGSVSLLEPSDISCNNWELESGEKLGDVVSNLVLVASKPELKVETPSTGQSKEMETLIEQEAGAKPLASATYNIGLRMCNTTVVKTGASIRISLGFPKGFGPEQEGVTYKAYHFAKKDGKLVPEEISCVVTRDGLVVTCYSFSPFAVVAMELDDEAVNTRKVLFMNTPGGDISGEKIRALKVGESQKVTLKAKDGYVIDKVNLSGKELTVTDPKAMEIEIKYDSLAYDQNIAGVYFTPENPKQQPTQKPAEPEKAPSQENRDDGNSGSNGSEANEPSSQDSSSGDSGGSESAPAAPQPVKTPTPSPAPAQAPSQEPAAGQQPTEAPKAPAANTGTGSSGTGSGSAGGKGTGSAPKGEAGQENLAQPADTTETDTLQDVPLKEEFPEEGEQEEQGGTPSSDQAQEQGLVEVSYDYLEPEEDNTFKIILAAIAGTGIVGVGIAIFLTLRR